MICCRQQYIWKPWVCCVRGFYELGVEYQHQRQGIHDLCDHHPFSFEYDIKLRLYDYST